MREELEKYTNEISKEMVGDWRPIDAMRLRLRGLERPKDKNKLSDGEKYAPNPSEFELYKFIRWAAPLTVVETGVQNGATTEIILGALELDKYPIRTCLLSFDIGSDIKNGDISTIKTWDGKPGQYIREEFKHHWKLILGDSVKKIKEHFKDKNFKFIDVFHHDSDHSTTHIEAELKTIYPYMKNGGYICMHDRRGRQFSLEHEGKMKLIYSVNRFDIWKVIK